MTTIHPSRPLPTDFSADDFWVLPTALPNAEERLHQLTQAIYADLAVLNYPHKTWDYSRDHSILEVAILGAGHCGKSTAFGLRRNGIERVRIFDRRRSGEEGPWRSFARNATLRTPKHVTGGLEWGIANLHFSRWCSARYGEDYWERIRYIPRLLWADYLDWYGKVLDLPIQNDTEIQNITWHEEEQCFWLAAVHQGKADFYKARFLVFATGMECAGGKNIPAIVRQNLPTHCYHHTMDEIDFQSVLGKRVVIVGGGSSAFDNALLASKARAESVDIVVRRPALTNLNRIRWSEWNGYHRHYIDLPDEMKWAYSLAEFKLGQLPPSHTYYQAVNQPNITLYTDAAINQLSYEQSDPVAGTEGLNGKIVGVYGDRTLSHNIMICGTGFVTDLNLQPELKTLAPHVARWRDRYTPNPGDEQSELSQYPYLGKSLEFTPKSPEHNYLKRCYYLCSGGALVSGFRAHLSGLQFAIPRVAYDIGKQLFIEHKEDIWDSFNAYDVKEY
ncbi:MAG: NAD(P)/FAD-dependent oxidoreductase [Cyanobacteria bacterium J06632_3]